MPISAGDLAIIAVNRFGYGSRGDELQQAEKAPVAWIKSKLTLPTFDNRLPSSGDIITESFHYYKQRKKNKKLADADTANDQKKSMVDMNKKYPRQAFLAMSADSVNQAINSSNSVSWRLLDFFSNHFSVTAKGRLMSGLAGTLERESIAPNLLGSFADLLLSVEQHPAMLIYLNNEKSFGANSVIGKKLKKGLNENLAREILELHTLGVDGPYQQGDVTELAKAITGWGLVNLKREEGSGFKFNKNGHEPGSRTLLGKKYQDNGLPQGEQMLRDLAVHPATAKYICYKLAHHFVSETPSKSLLAKMENTWFQTHGNIKEVMNTLFEAQESWLDSPQKYKTPREFLISSHRALNTTKIKDKAVLSSLMVLGQQPFNAGSPAGYSDEQKDWLGGSALMSRIDWTAKFSSYHKRANAENIMSVALGEGVSDHTYVAVMRAESRHQALTLLLMSPEFQRR